MGCKVLLGPFGIPPVPSMVGRNSFKLCFNHLISRGNMSVLLGTLAITNSVPFMVMKGNPRRSGLGGVTISTGLGGMGFINPG